MKEENLIEVLLTVFTIEKGEVKILLVHKRDEPYKGYWELPSKIVSNDEEIEQTIRACLLKESGLPVISYKLGNVFSKVNRKVDSRVIGINYLCFIDSTTIKLKQKTYSKEELNWFKIGFLPKLSYDNNEVIEESIKKLSNIIFDVDTLKHFFPSDFTLPELQQSIEVVLSKELDRRNFRKYFIKNELVDPTGEYTEGSSGRPAKLYTFKESVDTLEII